jgi:hypothetical protein
MPDFDDHPRLVPEGYRVRHRFFWRPVSVAGRLRWCQWVPIVQQLYRYSGLSHNYDSNWHDVGYLDEVLPTLKPEPFAEIDHG